MSPSRRILQAGLLATLLAIPFRAEARWLRAPVVVVTPYSFAPSCGAGSYPSPYPYPLGVPYAAYNDPRFRFVPGFQHPGGRGGEAPRARGYTFR